MARFSEVGDKSHYFLIFFRPGPGKFRASFLGGYGTCMEQDFQLVPGMILSNFQISGQNGLA